MAGERMSTNFYTKIKHAENHIEKLHIGKRSVGWCFALHAIYEKDLVTLEAWENFLKKEEVISIFDEYGKGYTQSQMIQIIKEDEIQKGDLKRHSHTEVISHGSEHYDLVIGHFR